jgi:hypothetical protein
MTNILGGLVKKRAEIAGEIEQLDQQIEPDFSKEN